MFRGLRVWHGCQVLVHREISRNSGLFDRDDVDFGPKNVDAM
jgi:hypothetical protein